MNNLKYREFKINLESDIEINVLYNEVDTDMADCYRDMVKNLDVETVNQASNSTHPIYSQKYQLTQSDIDTIEENEDFKIVSVAGIFHPILDKNQYILGSFPVSEIETQVTLGQFPGTTLNEFIEFTKAYKEDSSAEYYIRSNDSDCFYAYTPSDVVWCAIHTRKE